MIHNYYFIVMVINIKLCNYFDVKSEYKLDNVLLQKYIDRQTNS